MEFNLDRTLEVLERTPTTLTALLRGLPDEWSRANEGPETFSPYDVIGHLIHGELTDWVPRVRHILRAGVTSAFEPFDRYAQFEASKGKSLDELLSTFAGYRHRNVQIIKNLGLTPSQFDFQGKHPDLGPVTLAQLLATWAVHDLSHISQIVRVMSRQYAEAVGPWRQFLSILNK